MAALRKAKRIGKRASKFQYCVTYQSVMIECTNDKWTPHMISIAFHRRGRRLLSKILPWLPSPDNKLRGVAVWPEPETIEAPITLYKGQKDKSYETKEWEFSVINVDKHGHRKVLASLPINVVQYASALPFDQELKLPLKSVSVKVKKVHLEMSISSVLLKEGKATDDDMISIASMMSVSNLSTIGNLEDEDEFTITRFGTGRSISPVTSNDPIPSPEELLEWSQNVTKGYNNVDVSNMTTSWKNGLAFCAIIHHYRPDLLEFYQLTPNSIKENNRLAFTIASELGIFCPLTPNMMLLTDVPDKLAVSSFVYQMYNYFTRHVHSAVFKPHPPCQSPSPVSPSLFDISKFEELSLSISSISPSSKTSSTNPYSKYSHQTPDQTVPPVSNVTTPPVTTVATLPATTGTTSPISTDQTTPPVSTDQTTPSVSTDQTTPPVSTDQTTPSVSTDQATPSVSTVATPPVTTGATPPRNDQNCVTTLDVATPPTNDITKPSTSEQFDIVPPESKPRPQEQDPPSRQSLTTIKPEEGKSNKSRRASLPAISPTEDKSELYRKQAQELMKRVGIQKPTTFDALSASTKRKLEKARQKSHGSLTPSNQSPSNQPPSNQPPSNHPPSNQPPSNSSRVLSNCKSDSKLLTVKLARENEDTEQSREVETKEVETKEVETKEVVVKEKQERLKLVAPSSKPSRAAKIMSLQPPTTTDSNTDTVTDTNTNTSTNTITDTSTDFSESTDSTDVQKPLKDTDSVSAWKNHERDLNKDILQSQSDYVKTELILLQDQLQPLQERSTTIETEIREAMSRGDDKKEELLTVEYFKVLNEKNSLIKKQIELNLLEKEEDLEKRQFFINRELRPLAAMTDEEKTKEQKEREEELIKELIELINERDWLDQRLTNTTQQISVEDDIEKEVESTKRRSSLSKKLSLERRDNKECVIS